MDAPRAPRPVTARSEVRSSLPRTTAARSPKVAFRWSAALRGSRSAKERGPWEPLCRAMARPCVWPRPAHVFSPVEFVVGHVDDPGEHFVLRQAFAQNVDDPCLPPSYSTSRVNTCRTFSATMILGSSNRAIGMSSSMSRFFSSCACACGVRRLPRLGLELLIPGRGRSHQQVESLGGGGLVGVRDLFAAGPDVSGDPVRPWEVVGANGSSPAVNFNLDKELKACHLVAQITEPGP